MKKVSLLFIMIIMPKLYGGQSADEARLGAAAAVQAAWRVVHPLVRQHCPVWRCG